MGRSRRNRDIRYGLVQVVLRRDLGRHRDRHLNLTLHIARTRVFYFQLFHNMKLRGPLEIQKEKLKRDKDKIEQELGMKKQVGETNLAFKRRRANSPINKLKVALVFIFFGSVIILFVIGSYFPDSFASILSYLGIDLRPM